MDAEPLWQVQKREALRKKKEAQRREKIKDRRWHQFNAIVDTAKLRESSYDTLVLVALFRRADKAGRVDASIRQLASTLDINTKTARDSIARLRKEGVLKVLNRGSFKTASTYLLDYLALYKGIS